MNITNVHSFIWPKTPVLLVPPRDPIMDILSALAIVDFADRMSPDLRQRMRSTAFGLINEIVQDELGRPKGRG